MASERCPKCGTAMWQRHPNMPFSCPLDPKACRIAELESLLRASEARWREMRALIGEAPEGSHPDEWLPRDETWHKERANWASEVKRLKAWGRELETENNDLHAIREEQKRLREEVECKLDAALDQVVVIRAAIERATGSLQAWASVGFSTDCHEADDYQQEYLEMMKVINDTSATAQQRVEAIKREAVEKMLPILERIRGWGSCGDDTCSSNGFSPRPCDCGWVELKAEIAAILGEKEQG